MTGIAASRNGVAEVSLAEVGVLDTRLHEWLASQVDTTQALPGEITVGEIGVLPL